MYRERLICVTTLGIGEGRCRNCGDRILWVNTASQPGKPSRTLPFSWPRPFAIRSEERGDNGLRFEWWPTDKLHFVTCAHPQPRTKTPKPFTRGVSL